MATVTQSPTVRKAFFAQYLGLSGALVKPAEHVVFIDAEAGAVIALGETDYPDLVVLGEVGESTVQRLDDMLRDGAAAIACSRRQGVQ